MVPIKECQYLTDRTSIRGGISIGIADNGDGGLEIAVWKMFNYIMIVCLDMSLYISYLTN